MELVRSASVDSSFAKHEDGGRGSKAVPLYGNEIVALRYGCWKCLGVGAALACSARIAGRINDVDFILERIAGGRRERSRVTSTPSRTGSRYKNRASKIYNSTILTFDPKAPVMNVVRVSWSA